MSLNKRYYDHKAFLSQMRQRESLPRRDTFANVWRPNPTIALPRLRTAILDANDVLKAKEAVETIEMIETKSLKTQSNIVVTCKYASRRRKTW